MRGSLRLMHGATLACILAAGAQAACGKVEDTPDGGDLASGGTLGNASGGTAAISTGGQLAATGGGLSIPIEEPPPPPGPCDHLYAELDPPCSEDDVHGTMFNCVGWTSVSFTVPLSAIVPPAQNLSLVLLPLDSSLGAGGMGGAGGLLEASLELPSYSLFPETAGEVQSSTFSITEPAESVESGFDASDEFPTDYVEPRGLYDEWYAVGQIAVVQGDAILSQHRLLVDVSIACAR